MMAVSPFSTHIGLAILQLARHPALHPFASGYVNMKGRFVVNPFQELNLTPADRTSLVELANQCISTNLEFFTKYLSNNREVSTGHWKPLKEKEKLKVYTEKPEGAAAAAASGNEPTGSGLPMILCRGSRDDAHEGLVRRRLQRSCCPRIGGHAVARGPVPVSGDQVDGARHPLPLH
ncbi:hypothetical protein ON010_g15612 [Phytophthora cinnamomi]|nr:hypothetical protein ON010_g15612 [Phytophthora cinnamomi]